MEYIELFNQLDQQISSKIEDLQKQQEKLLERKKYLLDTKQKIHSFLSDAYQMKQLLDFNSDLAQSVKAELNKIFQGEKELNYLKNNQVNQPKIESRPNLLNNQDLEPQVVIDTSQEEPIKLYKFVDSDGKDTSF
jgi:hypothetical protein